MKKINELKKGEFTRIKNGDEYTLPLDASKPEVLADIIQGITVDQSQIMRAKIDKMYADYVIQNGREPQQTECVIRFMDKDANSECVTIQLSSDTNSDVEDNIFFYCNSLNDLKSLTVAGMNDFIVLDCIRLS